jgi:streptomycin 6-kinase
MTATFKDTLPDELVTHISAICGSRGEAWFDELPRTIRELEVQWSLKVLEPFPGIEYNFVAPAVLGDGTDVVVKIGPPYERTEIHCEAKYLKTRNGDAVIKLLAEDREKKAILLERSMPGQALFNEFSRNPEGSIQPAIDVLRSVLRSPPTDMTDVDTLDNWFNNFHRYRETDFPRDHAEKAFEIYERLSVQPGRTYYLHGDFHPGNIVTATREQYLLIDPKGIVGHIGYDIAVFLNNLYWWQKGNPNLEEFLQDSLNQLSAAFEIAEFELREWAYAYMVIGAWWNFDEMPEHYDADVAMSDIWSV